MSEVVSKRERKPASERPPIVDAPEPTVRATPRRRWRILPLLLTLAAIICAAWLGKAAWDDYVGAPWTRDGTVRAYVVTIAPRVAGNVVLLPVADNQFVHKGDLLLLIDPTNYRIDVDLADAAVQEARVTAKNDERIARRRQQLTDLATTREEKQTTESVAQADQAKYRAALAQLEQAKVNFARIAIRAPVNGWVTNLSAQVGDYATVGEREIALVDADSFWVDAYFEETYLDDIHVGDPANIKLMGYRRMVGGHVAGVARGINVANAQPNGQGLAMVDPIFTWVRLAQRVPVRIHIDYVPPGVRLVAGETASVQIDPHR